MPLFFILLYFLMTETYEDVIQRNWGAGMTLGGIMDGVYNLLPRLGEFYQRIAMHYMTPQLSFGLDLLFRLLTAAIASGVIYFAAVFVVGRKMKFEYKDVIIYLGIMIFLMLSIFSGAFTYRFSFANNYVLGLFTAVCFIVLFRLRLLGDRWWKLLGAFVIGFAFGISTEIAPVACLILICVWFVVKMIRREISWRDLRGRYRLQTLAVLGLVAGLVFFYLGGGIGVRTSGWYADTYDYVSPIGIFSDPISTVFRLVQHVWYNVRYIFFAIPLMLGFIFVETTLFKKRNKDYLFWQVMLFVFCVLFVLATSLIAVHDDLYARFMVPVFIAINMATMLFVYHVLEYAKVSEKSLKVSAIVLVTVGVVLVIDMTFAFALYNRTMAPRLESVYDIIQADEASEYADGTMMIPSPVFNLEQSSPYDWGSPSDYIKFGL